MGRVTPDQTSTCLLPGNPVYLNGPKLVVYLIEYAMTRPCRPSETSTTAGGVVRRESYVPLSGELRVYA